LKIAGLEISKFQLIQLGGFASAEARAFVGGRLPSHSWPQGETRFLLRKLGNLPFALELVAAFWNQSVLRESRHELWRRFKADIAGVSSSGVLDLVLRWCIDQVIANNEGAKAYRTLCSMSVLDPHGVPLILNAPWSGETARYTINVRHAVRKLLDLSLIRQSMDGRQCFVHELTREYVLKRLQQSEALAAYQNNAVYAVNRIFSGNDGVVTVWESAEILLPHVRQVLKYGNGHGHSKRDQAALIRSLATYQERANKYSDAVCLYSSSWGLHKEVFGETDLRTLDVAEDLAFTLYMDDKQDAAAKRHRQIESEYSKLFKHDNYRYLIHSGQYGSVLLEQGDFAEAERRLLEGLAGSKKLYDRKAAAATPNADPTGKSGLLGGANRHARKQRNDLARLCS